MPLCGEKVVTASSQLFIFQPGEDFGHIHRQNAGKIKNVVVPDAVTLAFHLSEHVTAHVQPVESEAA